MFTSSQYRKSVIYHLAENIAFSGDNCILSKEILGLKNSWMEKRMKTSGFVSFLFPQNKLKTGGRRTSFQILAGTWGSTLTLPADLNLPLQQLALHQSLNCISITLNNKSWVLPSVSYFVNVVSYLKLQLQHLFPLTQPGHLFLSGLSFSLCMCLNSINKKIHQQKTIESHSNERSRTYCESVFSWRTRRVFYIATDFNNKHHIWLGASHLTEPLGTGMVAQTWMAALQMTITSSSI